MALYKHHTDSKLKAYATELERRNRELDTFAHTVANNLSSLAKSITQHADFIKENIRMSDELYHNANAIVRSGQKMNQVIDELLDLVDLSEKREAYVQSLSRGMRQRLCLAHTLVHDPAVLLLDEPASGLDPRARVEMRELLKELGAMGKTVVVSSHILAELAELCDSIGIIERGQLITSGTVAEVSRQATQGRIIQIRTLSEIETTQNILKNHPGVGQIYPINGLLEIEFAGDEGATADLLEVLIASGIRIISFTETSSDLEDIFLRLTKGEVA